MEVEQNVDTTTQKDESVNAKNPSVTSKNAWIIALDIFLTLVTILLSIYVAYRNGYINSDNLFKPEEQTEEESQEDKDTTDDLVIEDEEEEETLNTYKGKVLSAELPDGWSITEYMDGDGTDMLTDTVKFTGLTGLVVSHNNVQILKLTAAYGVGFIGCPELPIFPDSSDAYLQEQKDINKEIQEETVTHDYTNTPYSDFKWFGKDFRRVGTVLYFDTVPNNKYFEPQCEKGLVTTPGLSFESSDGYKIDAYFCTINEKASTEELETLETILASMEKVN